MSLVLRKPIFEVSDQVRLKLRCIATEYGWKIKILDLERRGNIVFM